MFLLVKVEMVYILEIFLEIILETKVDLLAEVEDLEDLGQI